MSYALTPLERYETEQGCLVETRRQVNARGVLIEHVALSVPEPQPTDPEDTSAHDH